MEVIVERCAGLDVHRDNVVATIRVPGSGRRQWDKQTQTFKSTLAGLAQLAGWLADAGVTLVGMEATGVYWKTVFQALEERLECWLLNAHHLRNVPGRKTDVKDSEWICQLVQHGLVRPSFVPPPEIRRLRDLTRLRTAQSNERSRTIQRLEKVLQDAGIKLSSVASTTYSKSARAMLEALLSGVTDPEQLAELSKGKMRAKIPQLKDALQSRFQIEHHGIMVAQLLAHIDTLDAALQNLSERIEFVLAPHAQIIEQLCTIPGVQAQAAQVLIAECGLDMSVFPTVGHFASWAGACPGHHESAGRRRSGRTRPGPAWLTSQLTECARAAVRTKDTYLAAHYAQLRGRRGEQKRSARSATTCLSRTSTSSATKSRIATSARTGSASATQSSTAPDACSANSKRSATPSPSTRSSSPTKPPNPTHTPPAHQRSTETKGPARNAPTNEGIHRTVPPISGRPDVF